MNEMVRMVAAFASSLAIGCGIVRCGLGEPSRDIPDYAFRFALGAIAGLGASSLTVLAWLVLGGSLGPTYALFDSAALSITAALLYGLARQQKQVTSSISLRGRDAPLLLVLVAVIVTVYQHQLAWRVNPHGQWDAFAIWNLRARFFVRSGTAWRTAFSPELAWSHIDYPLLLSASVARVWAYSGDESTLAPAAIAGLFSLSGLVLVASTLWRLRGAVVGATGALLVAGALSWQTQGPTQYADVPVACYLIAAVALLSSTPNSPPSWQRIALAGLIVSMAAWTKSEGLAMIVATAFAWSLATLRREKGLAPFRVGQFIAGATPLIALSLIHRGAVMSTDDVLRPQEASVVAHKVFEFDRHIAIARAFADATPGAEHHLLFLLLAGAALLGARVKSLTWTSLVPALMLVVYYCVYLITPMPLGWHLGTSAERVLLQLWPVTVYSILMATPPIRAFTPVESRTAARAP